MQLCDHISVFEIRLEEYPIRLMLESNNSDQKYDNFQEIFVFNAQIDTLSKTHFL